MCCQAGTSSGSPPHPGDLERHIMRDLGFAVSRSGGRVLGSGRVIPWWSTRWYERRSPSSLSEASPLRAVSSIEEVHDRTEPGKEVADLVVGDGLLYRDQLSGSRIRGRLSSRRTSRLGK